jgi:mono/diheme cytochrome c family protein
MLAAAVGWGLSQPAHAEQARAGAPQGRQAQPPGAGRGGRPPDPAAVARGRQIFSPTCASCHGADAHGGPQIGTDLSRSTIATADDAGQQLGALLKTGRPERGMPAFSMSAEDVMDLSSFFRSVAPPAARGGGRGVVNAVVVGDAKAGEAYFNTAGCTSCHSATGDLKGIGSRESVAAIQGGVVMPRGSGGYPRGYKSAPDPDEKPKTVVITQPSGEKITGNLMWITDFTVTLVDASGTRRTIARDGDVPKVEVTDPLAWHIQHLKRLTDKDMHDVTAYLVTLE